MTIKDLEPLKQDAVILDLVERLLDSAFGLDVAVTVGLVDEYDFDSLQSQLLACSKDAGRIAHRTHTS
jgi:hypothetical protein